VRGGVLAGDAPTPENTSSAMSDRRTTLPFGGRLIVESREEAGRARPAVNTTNTGALLSIPVNPGERSALEEAMRLLRGEVQDGPVMAPGLGRGWKDGR
jgi:hypothetical protein